MAMAGLASPFTDPTPFPASFVIGLGWDSLAGNWADIGPVRIINNFKILLFTYKINIYYVI